MKDNNIYIKKDNGRYEGVGVCVSHDYLHDGLWYVKHKEHSLSITSVPYIASLFHMDINPVNLNLLGNMENDVSDVMESEEFSKVTKGSCTLNDIVHTVVKVMYDKYGKKNEIV